MGQLPALHGWAEAGRDVVLTARDIQRIRGVHGDRAAEPGVDAPDRDRPDRPSDDEHRVGGDPHTGDDVSYSTSPSAFVAPASLRGTSTRRLNSATSVPSWL